LTLQKTSLALFLAFVIAFSFVALIQLEKNSSLRFDLNAPLVSGQIALDYEAQESQSPSISNSTQAEVYDFIVANPGIQFRGICTGLNIAIGTAEFHLGVLKKAGLISFVRDGRYKRFFAFKKFSSKEMKLISLLRHETIREILKRITAEKAVPHSKLASQLSITSQGLTWQMNRLREEGIIQKNKDGIKVTYSLNEEYLQVFPELLYMIEQ